MQCVEGRGVGGRRGERGREVGTGIKGKEVGGRDWGGMMGHRKGMGWRREVGEGGGEWDRGGIGGRHTMRKTCCSLSTTHLYQGVL